MELWTGVLSLFALASCVGSSPCFGEETAGQAASWGATAGMHFETNLLGYVRHWIVVGLNKVSLQRQAGPHDDMRREAVGKTIVEPPKDVQLGGAGPFGEKL
ncbi:MAG TPA: hypothetical protein VGP72_02385 [Planctomycetota bacterium]